MPDTVGDAVHAVVVLIVVTALGAAAVFLLFTLLRRAGLRDRIWYLTPAGMAWCVVAGMGLLPFLVGLTALQQQGDADPTTVPFLLEGGAALGIGLIMVLRPWRWGRGPRR